MVGHRLWGTGVFLPCWECVFLRVEFLPKPPRVGTHVRGGDPCQGWGMNVGPPWGAQPGSFLASPVVAASRLWRILGKVAALGPWRPPSPGPCGLGSGAAPCAPSWLGRSGLSADLAASRVSFEAHGGPAERAGQGAWSRFVDDSTEAPGSKPACPGSHPVSCPPGGTVTPASVRPPSRQAERDGPCFCVSAAGALRRVRPRV